MSEKIPPVETSPERILSREEVLSQLRSRCEQFEVERELSDAEGVYLLEVLSSDGTKRFAYQRKGLFANQIGSEKTTIRVDWTDDSYSTTLADFDPVTGAWIDQ